MNNVVSMLTTSISPAIFARAFIDADVRYPEAAAANARRDTRGLLLLAIEREFPSLLRDAPHVASRLVDDVTKCWVDSTLEEFNDIAAGAEIAVRFAELEKKEVALKNAAMAGGVPPEPLPLLPDDEMRSVVVEAKLAYEARLTSELRKVRGSLVE